MNQTTIGDISLIDGAPELNISVAGMRLSRCDEILPSIAYDEVLGRVNVAIKESLTKPLTMSIAREAEVDIVIGKGVSAHILLQSSTASVVQVDVHEQAQADLYFLSARNDVALNLRSVINVAKEAEVRIFDIGCAVDKTMRTIDVMLQGEMGKAAYFGVDHLNGDANKDSRLTITHQEPKTQSEQNVRGVYAGKAASSFLGKVIVEREAKFCKAAQLYKSILLSEEASARARPELEISNNDISASHGASIGELDANALFYLCSRGLTLPEAQSLLINSLLSDIFLAIKEPSVRSSLQSMVARAVRQSVVGAL